MMKINYLIIALFLPLFNIFAQSFEGTLSYKIDVTILNDSSHLTLNNEFSLNKDTITYFCSAQGDYVSICSNNSNFMDIFLNEKKKKYSLENHSNIITALDVTIDLEELYGFKPTIELLDSIYVFGQFKCKAVQIKWENGLFKYYFDNHYFQIDPEIYQDYNYDQWYNYLKISKCLPIIIEKNYNDAVTVQYSLLLYTEDKFNNDFLLLPQIEEIDELKGVFPNKEFYIVKE
ncbi:hypothetical protein M2451_003805 [Dysgonomonas sp. PFB1-18]|uniref:hypothetical protein n=1 Tax=unclassified Dysgonomonas TaxID=2630389 RepID=UPI002474DD6E|nr:MULTISPECIES: hypothetical protein [unclassified Dysgonomonas]MDH6310941.1 hypothetical protein [Dysgonomonas sp. PF1-14]MDH6340844.1 hypothetical protein [Dysgonomonas sp. PF1-16]MDH6382464.1 hypothetical protein [Dysgonomonas sp. PFB1-18]MDH6399813.1 hypothetical protein [Dysgonomonas sp. PF1-23]